MNREQAITRMGDIVAAEGSARMIDVWNDLFAALSAPKAEAVTDRSGAPEAIWMGAADADGDHCVWLDPDEGGTKYVRSDLIPALTDEAVERAAKEMAFAGRMEHDTSEDAEEFWSHTAWGNRTRYRCMARAALLAAFPSKGEGE